jgi:hypothetical protein
VSKINEIAMQLSVKMQSGTHNIGILGTRLPRPSVETAKKWLAWEALKQEAGQWLPLHFLLDLGFILDTSGLTPMTLTG